MTSVNFGNSTESISKYLRIISIKNDVEKLSVFRKIIQLNFGL
jgi:hypothetical protein